MTHPPMHMRNLKNVEAAAKVATPHSRNFSIPGFLETVHKLKSYDLFAEFGYKLREKIQNIELIC